MGEWMNESIGPINDAALFLCTMKIDPSSVRSGWKQPCFAKAAPLVIVARLIVI